MVLNNPAEIAQTHSSYDVVVVGTGPVGTTLAIQLSTKGKKVLLLEGGAENYTDASQNRYAGNVVGLDWSNYKYLDGLRLRFWGGTSNHWVGQCVRLDAQDLAGWPISHEELYRHADIVEAILETEPYELVQGELKARWMLHGGGERLHQVKPRLRSRPVRFKTKYEDRIRNDDNITMCLNANLVDIGIHEGVGRVDWLELALSPQSERIRINTQGVQVVLGMGAIENTRFMLLLQKKYKRKSDWNTNLVGKNFLEHPHFDWDDPIAYCLSPKGALDKTGFTSDIPFDKQRHSMAICPTPEFRKKARVLNYAFMVHKARADFNVKAFERDYYHLIQSLQNSGVSGSMDRDAYDVHIVNMQCEINTSVKNYIALNPSDRDDFGISRVVLSIGLTDALRKTVAIGVHNLQRDLSKVGGVLIRAIDQPTFFMGGAHPLGTTRMGDSVDNGVVDKHGKIFGLENAYICSGSNFVSGGYANPTLRMMFKTGAVKGVERMDLAT